MSLVDQAFLRDKVNVQYHNSTNNCMYTYAQRFYLHFATCFRFLFFKIHINAVKAQAPANVRLVANLLNVGAILSTMKDQKFSSVFRDGYKL